MARHTITITVDPAHNDQMSGWAIDHIGDVDSRCQLWRTCDECSHWQTIKLAMREDIGLTDDVFYHGVEHKLIEREWMVPTDECGLQKEDSGVDQIVYDIFCDHGPGVHEVVPDYAGDGEWVCFREEEG